MTLLYQTPYLKDITASNNVSSITKDGNVLHIFHLNPEYLRVEAVKTPHYYNHLLNRKPLEQEGMLTVTARTDRTPLVMASILTSTTGDGPDVKDEAGDGFVSGIANGMPFSCTTRPGSLYKVNGFKTDAVAITWKRDRIFAAECKRFEKDGKIIVDSEKPVTVEIIGDRIRNE